MTAIPYLSDTHRTLVSSAIDKIVAKTQPEKIICYGVRTASQTRWSCFAHGPEEETTITIDLLVITLKADKRFRDQVANIIESLNSKIRFVPVVHSLDAVRADLEEDNLFFVTVCQKGILLYEQQPAPWVIPGPIAESKPINSRLALAQSFYQASSDCMTNENFKTAMFLLHQTVELSCNELLTCRLGYRSTTHSLRKLFALSENITANVTEIFPASTAEEEKLFELLQRAYVGVRYKEDYAVCPNDVFTLSERVSVLIDRVEQLCNEKRDDATEAIDEREFISIPHFESICLTTPTDVILHKGETPGIRIETAEDKEEIFQHAVEGKRLYLSVKNDTDHPIPYAVIHVTYVTLSGLVADECGTITSAEPIESESLGIIQSGKGKIDLAIEVSRLDATVTKSGELRLSGTADRAIILNTGPGQFDGADLEVSEAQVTIRDSGNISICVEDELKVHLHGTGILTLKGEPRLKTLSMNT